MLTKGVLSQHFIVKCLKKLLLIRILGGDCAFCRGTLSQFTVDSHPRMDQKQKYKTKLVAFSRRKVF